MKESDFVGPFSKGKKPNKDGVYQRKYLSGHWWFCKWKGRRWYCGTRTAKEAEREVFVSGYQDFPWRGVTKEIYDAKKAVRA